jgi:hypothetical protein
MDLNSSKSDDPPSWIRQLRTGDRIFLIAGAGIAIKVGLSGKWVISLGIVVFMVACIMFFIDGANQLQQRKRVAAAWSELAEKTGLELERDHSYIFENLSLSGFYRGRRVSISTVCKEQAYGEGSITRVFTHMSLEVNNTGGCFLTMRGRPFLNKIFKLGGEISGNVNFDRRFRFGGQPGDFLQKAQQIIIQHPILLRKPDGIILSPALNWRSLPSIQLQGSHLICLQSGVPMHVLGQVSILNLLCDLAELAEKMESGDVKHSEVMREE